MEHNGHVHLVLGAYLLGGLSEAEAAAVTAHLATCAICRDERDDLASVTDLLSLLGPDDAPVPE